MKIVVVDFAASHGGALSVLKDFSDYVKKYGQNHEWIFLLSDFYIEEQQNLKVEIIKNSRIRRLIFDDFKGAKIINKLNPDVIINFQNTLINGIEKPQIIYLHQAIPFQNEVKFSFFNKDEFKYAVIQNLIGKRIIKSLSKVDKVIVQTNWMKEAVLNSSSIQKECVYVIPPEIVIEKSKKTISKPTYDMFFYPTGDEIYKNFEIVENAVNKINHLDFKVEITIEREFNNSHIKSIGRISRDEVFDKYRKAILIFPSKIETFGMPLAEAREFNCIILAADTVFSREILKGYKNVYFFETNNPDQLSKLMKLCINHKINQLDDDQTKYNNSHNMNSWEKVMDIISDYE